MKGLTSGRWWPRCAGPQAQVFLFQHYCFLIFCLFCQVLTEICFLIIIYLFIFWLEFFGGHWQLAISVLSPHSQGADTLHRHVTTLWNDFLCLFPPWINNALEEPCRSALGFLFSGLLLCWNLPHCVMCVVCLDHAEPKSFTHKQTPFTPGCLILAFFFFFFLPLGSVFSSLLHNLVHFTFMPLSNVNWP